MRSARQCKVGFRQRPGPHGAVKVDADGCIVENSIEMYRVDNDAVYEPRSWDISEGLQGRWINLWGTPPPPTFGDPGIVFAAESVTSHAHMVGDV